MTELTLERALHAGRNSVRNCRRCTEELQDLHQAAVKVRLKGQKIREHEKRTCFGASGDMIWRNQWRWFQYYFQALAACDRAVCPHDSYHVDLTPRREDLVLSSPPALGLDGFDGSPEDLRDSALSDLIDIQDDAFGWKPIAYDVVRDMSVHSEKGSAFELVSDQAAEDRVWFEQLDESDWGKINAYCEGEPRWYVEAEDRYAAKHFMEKWMQGEDRGSTRDDYGRDHIAGLRRRHQGAQIVSDLRRRWQQHPHRVDRWLVLHEGVDGVVHAEMESYALEFDEWLEQWAPDAIAELDHQLMPKQYERPPMVRLNMKTKTAIWRIYQDEPLSELETELLREDLRNRYFAEFGERPEQVYVNTNWRPAVEESFSPSPEIPDELLEAPEYLDSIELDETEVPA